MKKILHVAAFTLIGFPLISLAQADDLKGLINELIKIINMLVPLLFGFALIGFMWGVIKYIASSDVNKLKEARKYIVFSVVAIAVMMSIWGLALFLKNSFFPRAPASYNPETGQVPSAGPGFIPCSDPNQFSPGC